jgi:Tol biopolymer transport system component
MSPLSIFFIERHFVVLALFAAGILQAAPLAPVELVSQPRSALVSRTGPGNSQGAVISADGRYVAFVSGAPGLVTGVDSGILQVYLRDRAEETTRLVSRAADAISPANRASTAPRMSADGRWILFQSRADNLVVQPTGQEENLFLWDRLSGTTRLVSINRQGTEGADKASHDGFLSSDGRWIVFESQASDLVVEPTSGAGDVFVRDMVEEVTHLVSMDRTGTSGSSRASYHAAMSDDGRYVSFLSAATNLVDGISGPPFLPQLYRRDLHAGQTLWLSNPHDPTLAPHREAFYPALSAQGRHVVFSSESTNLVANDPNTGPRVFWRDIDAGAIRQLNLVVDGAVVPGRHPVISPDGQWVAFATGYEFSSSRAGRIYEWHPFSGNFDLVTVAYDDDVTPASGFAHSPRLSSDGRWIAFISNATNLVQGANSGCYLVYQRDLLLGQTSLLSVGEGGQPASRDSGMFDVTEDGRMVAFESQDDGLVAGDQNRAYDIFLREIEHSRTLLISSLPTPEVSQGPNRFSVISRQPVSVDGRLLVFATLATDLSAADNNEHWDIYLRDLHGGTNRLVSAGTSGLAADGSSFDPVLSADGRSIAFLSDATDLVPGALQAPRNLYLHDLETGTTMWIAASSDSKALPEPFFSHWISGDGSRVVYISTSTNVVADVQFPFAEPVRNVYLYDRSSGINRLVSRSRDGLTGANFDCHTVLMSSDGGIIAYDTDARNLVDPWVQPGVRRVLVYEVDSQTTHWVHADVTFPEDPLLPSSVFLPNNRQALTPDGRWLVTHLHTNTYLHDLVERTHRSIHGRSFVAAISPDARFVALQPNVSSSSATQIVVVDLVHGAELPVTLDPAYEMPGNGRSHTPWWMANSRFLAFASRASNLIAQDENGVADLFLRDLTLGVTSPISVSLASSGTANSLSSNPVLGADGSTLVFESGASDLTDGTARRLRNLFLVRLGSGDQDDDGMDDAWEILWFGDLSRDGTEDDDGDGLNNLDEFRAGTNPVEPLSVVRVNVLEAVPSGQKWLVWSSVPGRTYVIQAKVDLATPGWENLPGSVIAMGPTTVVDLDVQTSLKHRYLRLLVVVP